jgi:hypothetical protein
MKQDSTQRDTDRCAHFHESIRMHCGGFRGTHSIRYADHEFVEGLIDRLGIYDRKIQKENLDDRKHIAWIDTNGCSKTFHEFSRDEKGTLQAQHLDSTLCELVEFSV